MTQPACTHRRFTSRCYLCNPPDPVLDKDKIKDLTIVAAAKQAARELALAIADLELLCPGLESIGVPKERIDRIKTVMTAAREQLTRWLNTEPQYREDPCPGCKRFSRITSAGCDHCGYEDK